MWFLKWKRAFKENNLIVSQVKMEFFMLLIVGILLLEPKPPMLLQNSQRSENNIAQ